MTPRLIYREADLPRLAPGAVAGRRALLLLARRGHAAQETLIPACLLGAAGVRVEFATPLPGPARTCGLDPVTIAMAAATPWSAGWRALRRARRGGWLRDPPALLDLEDAGRLEDFLDSFDAIIIPGGHGREYGQFIRSPRLRAVLTRFADSGRRVGLICHAVAAGDVCRGRAVTCWPRAYERVLGALPLAGSYFTPLGRPAEAFVAECAARVHTDARPWRMPHAVIDGNLVTAWGPWSSRLFALSLLSSLATDVRSDGAAALEVTP